MINPFRENVFANPWQAPRSEVPGIHQSVFDECLRGVEHVRTSQRSAAILIHGEAGSGKTHLLSRLRKRLALKLPTATDREEALYVWVRLQSSPRMIWRTVRRTLVTDWFRRLDGSRNQFDRILFHRLAEIRVAEGDLEPWYEFMLQEKPDELKKLIDQISDNLELDRNTHIAFQHIAFGRHRRDLQAWLSGDSLPEADLERMGLVQEDANDEDREALSREVVIMLCRLAGNGLPIVLSFDQVEALESKVNDQEAMFAFGQLVSTLHDETTNVLIISSVQSTFSSQLLENAREADRDRMRSLGALSLATLTRCEAEQLIRARLEAVETTSVEKFPDIPFWPLTEADVEQHLSEDAMTPRRLLQLCAERFDVRKISSSGDSTPTQEGNAAETVSPSLDVREAFLSETWETLIDEKLNVNSPERTEEIVRHAFPYAVKLSCPEQELVQDDDLKDVAIIFECKAGKTGLSICTQANMTSLAGCLKRLQDQHGRRKLDRLVILRDHRRPITKGAKKAKERLAALEQAGAVVAYPSVEVLAALDALRALLSDSKSGDLASGGESITPQTLEEWFESHLPNDLRDFVIEVIGTADNVQHPPDETLLVENLNTILAENPVKSLDVVAQELGCSAAEIAALAKKYPEQFRLLGESPGVLFRAVRTSNASPLPSA